MLVKVTLRRSNGVREVCSDDVRRGQWVQCVRREAVQLGGGGRLRDLQLLQQRCYEERGLAKGTSEGTIVLCR